MTESICSEVNAPLKEGMICEKAAGGPAVADDRFPCQIVLGRGLIASGEVRKCLRFLKSNRGIRRSAAVSAVTSGASRFENFFTGFKLCGAG